MTRAPQILNDPGDRDHDPFKMVCYPWAGLPMVSLSLCTKFELFVHYEDMNDNGKCRNGIVWGG